MRKPGSSRLYFTTTPAIAPRTWTKIVQQAAQLAAAEEGLQRALDSGGVLVAATMLETGGELERRLRDRVYIEGSLSPMQLGKILETELSGAEVYRARTQDEWKLVISGELIWFRAKIFDHNDEEAKQFAFVEILDRVDVSGQPMVARLPNVAVFHQREVHDNFDRLSGLYGSWHPLFRPAGRFIDLIDERHRSIGRFVQVLNRVDTALWQEEFYPVVILHQEAFPGKPPHRVEIKEDETRSHKWQEEHLIQKRPSLVDYLKRRLEEEEPAVELGTSSSTTTGFDTARRFRIKNLDLNTGAITLSRTVHESDKHPPIKNGWLRPWKLATTFPLFRRRKFLEQELPDDVYLLDALVHPERPFHRKRSHRDLAMLDEKMDKDKKNVVRNFLDVVPPCT